jgi:hypothetical protein
MHTYGLSSPGPYDTGRSFLLCIYSAEHDTQGKLHLGSVPHPYLIYTSDNDIFFPYNLAVISLSHLFLKLCQ